MPDVVMIGGANGSGKTTIAMTMLANYLDVYEFVNADEIAKGINPIKPETADMSAGRVMINRINDLIKLQKNFAFETTCSGQHHLKTLSKCRKAGYNTYMIFLWLPSAEVAIERVKTRVEQGGHSIPEDTIRRRYSAGMSNAVKLYLPNVNNAVFIDGSDYKPKKIAEKKENEAIKIYNSKIWSDIINTTS